MTEIEVVLGVLLVVALVSTLARRIGVPYPVLMVVAGLVLGGAVDRFLGIRVEPLAPELVFVLFLPPILFSAAYFTSIRDFRANLRPIALLAVGLVTATTVTVAAVAYALIPGLGWPAAFALGAIVSPPDAVAATAIFQRLGAPQRVVTVLEGESLVNDATALVAYRLAVAAVGAATFSAVDAIGQFVVVAVGGIVVGIVVAVVMIQLLRRLHDPPVEVTLSLLMPFAAYLPAEALHVSGVLATVTAGLYIGRESPRLMASDTRLLGSAVWQMVIFLINGFVFVVIGLQLPAVLRGLAGRPIGELALQALAVCATVILVRLIWVFPATYLPRWLSSSLRERDPSPPPRAVFLVAYAGLRGVVSLAAALALPLTVADGEPFPQRDLLIFLTFTVILVTLVGQGLTLGPLVRRMGIVADADGTQEEATARAIAAQAAVARIGELSAESPAHQELLDQLLSRYAHRSRHSPFGEEGADPESDQELIEHEAIRRSVIDAERAAVIRLRDTGAINDEVLRRLERELDLEELRMEA